MARKGKGSRIDWISTAERERLRLAPDEFVPGDREVSIAESLAGLLEDVRLADKHWLNQLREHWAEVAGDVAKHTEPGRIDNKCLYVAVDSSVWLSELSRYGGKALLSRIRDAGFADRISAVKFVIGA